MTVSFSLSIAETYDGFIDYWGGHGHAFVDKHVVACIVLQCPIDYRESNKELIDELMSDFDAFEWLYLSDVSDHEKEQIRKLDVRAFLASEFKHAEERAFGPVESLDPDADESPQFCCVLHVWREESDQEHTDHLFQGHCEKDNHALFINGPIETCRVKNCVCATCRGKSDQ